MNEKIDEILLEKLEAAKSEDPQREIPIIVTLKPEADTSILEKRGFNIQYIIEEISVVSGSMAASQIEALADLEQVELIEFDGPVYAQDEE